MLTKGYLDQPYCIVLPHTKRWVCTITGSAGGEGSASEHVQTLYSDDSGLSWSVPVSVEPSPLNTEVRKTAFLRYHFILEPECLPRQARDKHRETTQKKGPFSSCVCYQLANAYSTILTAPGAKNATFCAIYI